MSTSRDKLIEAAKKLDLRRQIDCDEYYLKKVNEIINDRSDTKKISELYQHIYMLQHVHKRNKLTPLLKELSDSLACYLGYSYISEIFDKEAKNKKLNTSKGSKGQVDDVYYPTNINPSFQNSILDKDMLDYIEERLMNIDKFSNEKTKCNPNEHLVMLETFYTMKDEQPTYKKMRDDFLHKSLEKNIQDLNFNLDGYKVELKQLIFDNNDLTDVVIDNEKIKQTKKNKQKP